MLAAAEAAALQAARARRHPGPPLEAQCDGRFTNGVEVLNDGSVLHIASFCLTEAELHLGSHFAQTVVHFAHFQNQARKIGVLG